MLENVNFNRGRAARPLYLCESFPYVILLSAIVSAPKAQLIAEPNMNQTVIMHFSSYFFLVIGALIFAAVLISGMINKEFRDDISNPEKARGLITFFVALASITMISRRPDSVS